MIDRFRRRPLYSADSEDTRTELAVLEIGPEDDVVAICAGGGRALSLLSAGPRALLAVDKRLDQIFQLELKAAALEAFDYDTLLAFLGIADSRDRMDHYAAIRPTLSPGAKRYWDHRPALVRAGPYYAGRSETVLIRLLATMRRLGLLAWAEPFFACETVESQRVLLDVHRDRVDRGLRWVRLFVNSASIYAATQDPGFLRTTGVSVAEVIARRLVAYAEENLVRDSFLLTMLVRGRLRAWDPLPAWLTRSGSQLVRKHLSALQLTHAGLTDVAARHRATRRLKWSVSDLSCWMSEVEFQELLTGLRVVSPAGSRICSREFAAKRRPSAESSLRLWALRDLSTAANARDLSALFPVEAFEVLPRGGDPSPHAVAVA